MKPLFTNKSPFENPPRLPERIQWVKPELVCEISFAEWTQDGELRQTVFLGWREDKNPKESGVRATVKTRPYSTLPSLQPTIYDVRAGDVSSSRRKLDLKSQIVLTLADPGSSVTVRDANGKVEYLG